MSIFEHVSVFISIILGLAVVHLLGGLSLILDTRVRVRVYWVHLLWTCNLLVLTILVWLGNFVLAPIENVSVAHFLNLVVYCMVIYLMAGLLYPVRGAEVEDFREHFHANRPRFFAVGLLFVATDAVDGFLEARTVGLPLNLGQYLTLAVFSIFFAIGIFNGGARFNGFAAIVFFIGMLGFAESLVRYGIVDA